MQNPDKFYHINKSHSPKNNYNKSHSPNNNYQSPNYQYNQYNQVYNLTEPLRRSPKSPKNEIYLNKSNCMVRIF